MTRRGRLRAVALLGGAGLAAGLAVTVPSAAVAAPVPAGSYLVQLADPPTASYTGGVAGLAATRPAAGAKLDTQAAGAVRYRDYLRSRHDAVIGSVGNVGKVYDYTTAFNGFAARMSSATAARLAAMPGVLRVSKNEIVTGQTISTPHFLGLDLPGGVWDKVGGQDKAGGAGLVIGEIDSGIWPENPAFAPLPDAGPLPRFHGVCQAGEQWDASDCTNKIVGARFYDAGFGGADGIHKAPFIKEIASPRDSNGHGSHTASIAAGDAGVPVTVNGQPLGKASGMAPAARIAVYKALWNFTNDNTIGTFADFVQAIDDAVADGVDVINYSIGASTTTTTDPPEQAFLGAADAGVFVSAAVGNTGPGTAGHLAPWVTAVAAGTHDRSFQATVTLGSGAHVSGAGLAGSVPAAPAVLAGDAGLPGADPTGVRQCAGALDPAKVAGRVVVCDNGGTNRLAKSQAVRQAGGVGMVLANVRPELLNIGFPVLPTVQVADTGSATIKAYVAGTADPTLALDADPAAGAARAPQVAGFSATGPVAGLNGDVLKPDIMAPGVEVIGAVSPVMDPGRDYDLKSGTSMATPHISGIALLIKQLHPTWTPMMIKSALLTTASRTDNRGLPITTATGATATAFDYGSGEVNPNAAADPGLVYNSGRTDWLKFLCGAGDFPPGTQVCQNDGIDPSDLNQPNIAIGDLLGTQTVTRTVTNVVPKTSTYTVTVHAPAGIAATVSPATLTLPPGASRQYTVTLTRTTAPLGAYAFGGLDWADGVHTVHSQLAVRPLLLGPVGGEFNGTGTSGSTTLRVTPGFTGTLTTVPAGLVPATPNRATLTNPTGAGFPSGNPQARDDIAKFTVTVPPGTSAAEFATLDADVPAGTDMDMFVYRGGTNTRVGTSAGATAQERVTLLHPDPGSYDVYVQLFATAAGVTSQPVTMYATALGGAATGNLTATPASTPVPRGISTAVTVSWAGLTPGTPYLGRISYTDGTDTAEGPLIRIIP